MKPTPETHERFKIIADMDVISRLQEFAAGGGDAVIVEGTKECKDGVALGFNVQAAWETVVYVSEIYGVLEFAKRLYEWLAVQKRGSHIILQTPRGKVSLNIDGLTEAQVIAAVRPLIRLPK